MRSSVLGLAAVIVTGAGCVIPFVIPPLRGEVGAASQLAGKEPTSLQIAAGAHLASGTQRDDQRFDIGAGYIRAQSADTTAQGIYVDGALFVSRSRRVRTAAGARGELLWMPMGTALAAKLRLDHELFGTGQSDFQSHDRCGVASGKHIGTAALGLFAEAGPTWLPGGDTAWTASAGITLRLPTAVGVWVGIPGC